MAKKWLHFPTCACRWLARISAIILLYNVTAVFSDGQDVVGCGGFVQSEVEINYSLIEVKLYTKQGTMKYKTDCAPNNGYFLIPLYDKGTFVLKVEPPAGWSFEPSSVELVIDGTTDKCSKGKDINFVFTGFSVSGKVLSKGRTQGPSGVHISLKSKDLERKTVTTESGLFSFARVMPASFHIIAFHPTWKFQKSSTEVVVSSGNVNIDGQLVVAGYDVKGHVLNDGQPIKGVHFLLFSKSVASKDGVECEPVADEILQVIKKGEESPLCSVKSGADGVFVFIGVPSGEYSLIPFYKGEHITFDVVPAKLTFNVNFKSVVLKTPFQVHGFSVSGQVLTTEGSVIFNANVDIGDGKAVSTSAEGVYTFDNITSGTYTIQASKTNYYFEPVTVDINPNTPRLPDIKPSGYNLCGTVLIDEFPPGVAQVTGRRVTLQTKGAPLASRSVSTTLDKSGNFCFKVSPGTHHIQPVVTGEEATAGLVLKPTQLVVTVKNAPVLDVKFTQFRATVSGTVKCIGACSGLSVSLSSIFHPDTSKHVAQVSSTESTSGFSFKNVLPGKYKAFVLQDSWCWKNKSLEFVVLETDVVDLEFEQSGYILKCSLSHSITLNFSIETGKEVVGSFNLTKGVNRFCLAAPGVYNLIPKSCHKFEQDVYKYDTSSPSVLTLSAVKHQLVSRIQAETSITKDVKVNVRSLMTNEVVVYQPSELAKKPAETKVTNETEQEKLQSIENVKSDKFFNFTHWGRYGEEFVVTPSSSELLFYPPRRTVTVTDGCPGAVIDFNARLGVFLEGQISPPLKDVQITISVSDESSSSKGEPLRALTDDKGQYRVGPLDSARQYEISASKDGYVINVVSGKKGYFLASKLGQIDIQVADKDNQPLDGVLLSLSAGQFRSNNVTFDNGRMSFINLSPGQYFFRPMLKEYTFTPASQMINVDEGATVTIEVKGKRVAFSCYGSITSLNGEPEKRIVVEATGLNSCEGMQEETRSDDDGNYRLRGLQPGCTYRVKVKSGESNPNLERASPSFIDIQVPTGDIENVNIIAFRLHNQFEVTGNVITDNEFIPSLKVLMYRENNLDLPVQTTVVGIASFFQFPPIPNDEKTYVIRLESSLSPKLYEFQPSEATVSAAGRKTHVTFNFRPKRRTVDHEHAQGSLLALPLLILIAVLVFNHNKVLPYLQQGVQIVQGLPADQLQVPAGPEYDHLKTKRKQPVRKR